MVQTGSFAWLYEIGIEQGHILYNDVVHCRMLNKIGTCIKNNLPGLKNTGSKKFSPFTDCDFHFY